MQPPPPPLALPAPPFKLQKLILRFCASVAEQRGPRSPPPVFHISYTAHWMASPHRVTAGHIYERCIPETYHWPDIARAQRFESHPALYANSLMEPRHFARSRCHGRTAAVDQQGNWSKVTTNDQENLIKKYYYSCIFVISKQEPFTFNFNRNEYRDHTTNYTH